MKMRFGKDGVWAHHGPIECAAQVSFAGSSTMDAALQAPEPSTDFPWKEFLWPPTSRRGLIFRALAFAVMAFILLPYYLTVVYTMVDPPISALMARQAFAGHSINWRWRDLDKISPNLITQVIVSEDGRFCQHWGVDWNAIDEAIDAVADGRPKGGGSTLSMQTAKNLFLWNRPAYLRKLFEVPLAYYMDFILGKRRMMEIYLNIVEWAPGVYGAEAAAQHHFGKSASELSPQEAAQLAAALPNPKRRNAGRPGPATFALANRLRLRAARARAASACVLTRASQSTSSLFD
jgi:monofunctional biosynthetic peptidoglycan transglycosylase